MEWTDTLTVVLVSRDDMKKRIVENEHGRRLIYYEFDDEEDEDV